MRPEDEFQRGVAVDGLCDFVVDHAAGAQDAEVELWLFLEEWDEAAVLAGGDEVEPDLFAQHERESREEAPAGIVHVWVVLFSCVTVADVKSVSRY